MDQQLQEYLDFALDLARESGTIARQHFSADITFEPKGDNSPVTQADLAINQHVIDRCQAAYPTIGVLGEEASRDGSDKSLLWVCDPIDGTSPYAFGMSASTFCLALVQEGIPVIGIVYDFMNERLFHAVKGAGAYLNGEPIKPATYPPMKLVNYEWWNIAAVELHNFHEIMFAQNYQTPNYTSSGFMGMQVVMGRIAAVVYVGKSAWDVAATKVIAEESGRIVRNLYGDDQRYDGAVTGAIIAHPDHYETILAAVQAASKRTFQA
jgi:fructose-1,6-bisphosphatase/inositol monophosphatase family enzyme